MRLRACSVDALDDGEMQLVEGTAEPIALFRVKGSYYATSDVCTHGQSSLSEEGELNGYTIECGWHFGCFDVRTGAATALPCSKPLRSYPVVVEGDDVLIEIDVEA